MAVLITGGAGFLGRVVARHFESPVILDLKESKEGVFEFGSITAWSDIAEVFRKHDIDGIIHTAAELSIKAEKSHMDAFRANAEGTLNVLEACRIFDVKKVVFTSSHSVYGPKSYPFTEFSYRDPTTFYGATKACSEILGTYYRYNYGIDFRAVRLPILIGPLRKGLGASVVFSSLIDDAFFKGSSVISLPQEAKLPVLYVKDAAELVFKLYSKDCVSQPIFNAGGVVLSIKEIMKAVKKFIPEFKPKFRIDDESKKIAQQWTLMTEMVEKTGVIDKYSRIEELDWEIRWKNPEEIVEDHLRTLAEVKE
ncbi:MAG: NAD(P)-dependent oxidoreductase [Archaeoglobus sp.]|uniref:NAD-dependent epimerase/dehydratase family protein n=1 Tax=Archaeoglobus sp. TaxID=1872626 RepID=UPI001D593EF6|nr:NAD(P)-dependent oxidoreductase [Archaeoglobus sp.]MBO8179310.1 NAD(P)-dependent oxidoreductase [Archaeoglobus sp.]